MKINERNLPAAVKQRLPTAALPESYQAARQALQACQSIDEVKDWADKAAAAATYAKMAQDDTLFALATRIQLCAYEKLGEELLKYNNDIKDFRGRNRSTERSRAISDSKLKPHQAYNAIAIARMDSKTRNDRIEQPAPPSVAKLAAEARQITTYQGVGNRVPESEAWRKVIAGEHGLQSMVNFVKTRAPAALFAANFSAEEAWWIRENMLTPLMEWLDEFEEVLPKGKPPRLFND